MKIAVFGHKRIPSREGGVEIVAEELSVRMAQLGHRVTCYNRAGHHVGGARYDEQQRKNYKGVRLKTVWTLDQKGLAAVTSSISAAVCASLSRAEVVHIHAEGPAFMSWLPRLFGKRVIVTVHGLDWGREKWKHGFGAKYIMLGEKMAVRYAHEIIVLSKNVQEYFLQTYGRKTVWIPNGVTKPEPVGEDHLDSLGLKKEEYILFLGRLVPEKGIHYLIEAYKNIKTHKKLVIAGGSSDTDDYVRSLHRLAQDDERIVFTGFVQGQLLRQLYGNAYIYVLPSDLEGMPLSLLEAMSFGRCCLVSDIAECAEVVEEHGVLFRRGDVKDLAQKLQRLCDDHSLVRSYKDDACAYICRKYSWQDVTAQTLALYGQK
ncbi:MAG: glycosyltransferase family 4 protein [Oscillospiraceae bacterium]|nr:glycosyltransferase family 4 protein [Oscillospiraceae bacterium]